MGRLARAAAVAMLALWMAGFASPVSACEGFTAPLATGIRGASSIFYARIVSERESGSGFYELRLQVGRVVRGTAQTHVVHLLTPRACDTLAVGDFGVVVLGSVDPFGVGPNNRYNFFYVIGPGHTSAAAATRILSGLPATDTAQTTPPSSTVGFGWLALVAGGATALFSLVRAKNGAWSAYSAQYR